MGNLFAASDSRGFCLSKAKEWKEVLHQKNLEDIGVIQGYSEVSSHEVKTLRPEMDHVTETYTFFVDAENDEGDTWTWLYGVTVEGWYGAQGWDCYVVAANYGGLL